jgi:hypothetical protein
MVGVEHYVHELILRRGWVLILGEKSLHRLIMQLWQEQETTPHIHMQEG